MPTNVRTLDDGRRDLSIGQEEPHGGIIVEDMINFGAACELGRRTGSNAFL